MFKLTYEVKDGKILESSGTKLFDTKQELWAWVRDQGQHPFLTMCVRMVEEMTKDEEKNENN